MSPYDDGWLLDAERIDLLALEIALNDPRTLSMSKPMCMGLVCSLCRGILKRQDLVSPTPPPELAPSHFDHREPSRLVCGIMVPPDCDGGGKPAVWHPIAED